ncbi:hypothetical protein AAFF_G00193350 [Aldrovandia affinis]|uniref:Ig-like domain-containing protein n=1 Tax=Aldrovandia affinis TaxID=143900 RepID=A0AAD7SXB5_9TELE|nr:hypothetical protein AAFF_G00193350 [Aldrovandia affinis]
MADKHYIITTLSLIITKFAFGEVTSINYGILDGEITLKANVVGVLQEILWKWNLNKVLEVDKDSRAEYGRFKGRTDLNFSTGDLTISNLTEGDNGYYSAEAQIEGKLQYSSHNVEIIDPVTHPVVTCEVSDMLTLICTSDLNPLTHYSWERSNVPVMSSSSELVLQSTENRDSVYTCVVTNPVSERRKEIAVHHCFTLRDSIITYLAIAGVILCVALGVAIGIWFYCKKRNEASQKSATMHEHQETRMDVENQTPTENAPLIGMENDKEPVQEKNSLDNENVKDKVQNSKNAVLPPVSPPGQGGVSEEQRVLNCEDMTVQVEQAGGIDDQQDPSAKGQAGDLTDPLSKKSSNVSEAEVSPGSQIVGGPGGVEGTPREIEGQEEQPISGQALHQSLPQTSLGSNTKETLKVDGNGNDPQSETPLKTAFQSPDGLGPAVPPLSHQKEPPVPEKEGTSNNSDASPSHQAESPLIIED